MTPNRKYHWAIPVSDPSKHRNAWKAYVGGHYVQACGRRKKSAVGYPAERFVAKSQRNPAWYCSDCARAARLALAKESAPKPADVVWPKPRPISEARDTEIFGYCPDIGWRRLSRIGHKWGLTGAEHIADYEPTHFLPLPPEVK